MVGALTLIAVEFVQFTDCYESSPNNSELGGIGLMAVPWNPYEGINQNLIDSFEQIIYLHEF